MQYRFIGDIHGKFLPYLDIIEGHHNTVQIGDYGVGFGEAGRERDEYTKEQAWARFGPHGREKSSHHRFIRGNHDNPKACRENPNWIPDGHVENDIMFIGGAYSIDKEWRTEGHDWWADEELSYNNFDLLISKAIMCKPKIMVTHDCPEGVIPHLFKNALPIKSITQSALDIIRREVKPELWIFGHWHEFRNEVIDNTRFVCLAELQYGDMDLTPEEK